jgi:Family of unknown function (DUF6599)
MAFLLRSVYLNAGVAACFIAFAPVCASAQAHPPIAKKTVTSQALLPAAFAGWAEQGTAKTGTSAAGIDAANANVLSEYGLKDFAEAAYRHGGDTVDVRAMRFPDATGAYGAYTFYREPGMEHATVGNGAARDAHRIIFWSGVTVVEATFDHPAADEERAMKALAAKLPVAVGSEAIAPTLPQYLPTKGLDRSTVRYAIGPAAYAQGGGVLPGGAIDFSQDAEVVMAQYSTHGGHGTLTLIGYPTPQMAMHAEKDLTALVKGPLPATLQKSSTASLEVHRSGPMVAVTSGEFSAAEAHALVDQVKYQAEVTLNRNVDFGHEVRNAAKMLLGIAYLTGVVVVFALLIGVLLGGGRALWRVMHGKPISTVYEEDFISLKLKD